jgi:hypothetical protein
LAPLVIPVAAQEGDAEAVWVLECEAGDFYGQHSEEMMDFSSQGSIIIPMNGQKKQKNPYLCNHVQIWLMQMSMQQGQKWNNF